MSSPQVDIPELKRRVPHAEAAAGSNADFLPSLGDDDSHLPDATLEDLERLWFRPFPGRTIRDVIEEIEATLVAVDLRIERQLNAILHHPKFQALEAGWRGVQYLVDQLPIPEDIDQRNHPPVRILIFSATWTDWDEDLVGAVDFDTSCLFRKVYTENYGMAGGEPIGLLIGNYELEPNDANCRVLSKISEVAAAAFCPFVTGVSPRFWGVHSFNDLRFPERVKVSDITPRGISEAIWNSLRNAEDSRFLGLAVPRVVLRGPHDYQSYRSSDGRKQLLRFREDISPPDLSGILWGTAAWALGEVVIREFLRTGWFGEMTGVEPAVLDEMTPSDNVHGRGLVVGLPTLSYGSDRPGLQPKPSTDLFLTEHIEGLFVEQGFLPLTRCPGGPYSAFYSAPSLQRAKTYDRQRATANAALSTTLDAMLCVSRFAHYLKGYAREWLGRTTSPEALQREIHEWLVGHVGVNIPPDADWETRRKYPLTAVSVEVVDEPGSYGAYKCQLNLCPRLSPDGMIANIRLMTEFVRDGAEGAPLTV